MASKLVFSRSPARTRSHSSQAAYFTQATVDDLGTVDDIPGFQDLIVPSGLFKSTRVGKNRGRGDEHMPRANETSSKTSTTVTRTYAPFPSPLYNHYPRQSKSPTSESVMMYEPYENSCLSGYPYAHDPSPRYSMPASAPDRDHSLPPIQGYSDGTAASSPAMGYLSISNPMHSNVHPVAGSPAHAQGASVAATSCHISARPTSHRPPLIHQSTAVYPPPPPSHRSPSPAALNITHAEDTYTDRSPGFYFPSEAPPTYTDRPVHGSSTTYSYPTIRTTLDVSGTSQPARYCNSTDSGPSHHEFQIATSQPSPPHCPLPPLRIDPFPPSYELLPTEPSNLEGRRGSIGPDRDLAPIYALTRPHPYRRDPLDDKTLRLLTPRSS